MNANVILCQYKSSYSIAIGFKIALTALSNTKLLVAESMFLKINQN